MTSLDTFRSKSHLCKNFPPKSLIAHDNPVSLLRQYLFSYVPNAFLHHPIIVRLLSFSSAFRIMRKTLLAYFLFHLRLLRTVDTATYLIYSCYNTHSDTCCPHPEINNTSYISLQRMRNNNSDNSNCYRDKKKDRFLSHKRVYHPPPPY